MTWAAAIAAIFTIVGQLLKLQADGKLTQDNVDAGLAAMKDPGPAQPEE